MQKLLRVLLMSALVALMACATETEDGDDDSGTETGTPTESADDAGADDEASVSFQSPSDGDTVTSPVTLVMAAEGVDIEPAGDIAEGSGHLHVMIDTDCVTPGETIPSDDTHVHFGADPLTERELELEPGDHTLCLQLGDGAHTALDVTDTISITVE